MEEITGFRRWRAKWPLCPTCTHRSRLAPIMNLHAWACRWGHTVTARDLYLAST